MDVRRLTPIVVGLMLAALVLAGCTQTGTQGGGGGGTTGGTGGTGSETASGTTGGLTVQQVGGIIDDWTKSKHSGLILLATEEQDCVRCHDGGAFAQGITDPKQLKRDVGPETSATSFPVATDCRACHTGKGLDILKSGTIDIPSKSGVNAGAGAICMACHNARRPASIDDTRQAAPHYGPMADVQQGSGGIRTGAINPGSTQKHATVEDTCVHCHMADKDGVASHTFTIESTAPCKQCHNNIGDSFDFTAKGDYDGNGKKEGLQTEVKGLLAAVTKATQDQVQGATFSSQQGRIVFMRGDTTVTPVPGKVYAAAYNVVLITNDKSEGIHNPRFTVDLLQQTYQELTGAPLKGAQPFGGGTASQGTTGTGSETSGTGGTGSETSGTGETSPSP
jgi:hypothetical protein